MLLPEQLQKDSEDSVQTAFIQQCRLNIPTYPQLKWLHSSLNGAMFGDDMQVTMSAYGTGYDTKRATGRSQAIRAAKLKGMGSVSGVWDLFLPFANCGYRGIYFETKRPPNGKKKGGVLSKEQIEFGEFVWNNGFYCVVYDDWKFAWDIMQHYLEGTL